MPLFSRWTDAERKQFKIKRYGDVQIMETYDLVYVKADEKAGKPAAIGMVRLHYDDIPKHFVPIIYLDRYEKEGRDGVLQELVSIRSLKILTPNLSGLTKKELNDLKAIPNFKEIFNKATLYLTEFTKETRIKFVYAEGYIMDYKEKLEKGLKKKAEKETPPDEVQEALRKYFAQPIEDIFPPPKPPSATDILGKKEKEIFASFSQAGKTVSKKDQPSVDNDQSIQPDESLPKLQPSKTPENKKEENDEKATNILRDTQNSPAAASGTCVQKQQGILEKVVAPEQIAKSTEKEHLKKHRLSRKRKAVQMK